MERKLNRRNFLTTTVKGSIGATVVAGTGFKRSGEKPIKIADYRRLGRTEFKVSDISLGAGNLTNASVLEAALDMGINYIDSAEHYGRGRSEQTIGEVVPKRDRDSVFITTKLNLDFFGGTSKKELRERFDKCLERLQLDYVDCLMMHMAQSVEQIRHEDFHLLAKELKSEGKIRFAGLSNHGPEHRLAGNMKEPMEKVITAAAEDGRFDVVLFVYNFIQKEQGESIIEACKKADMGLTLMKVNPVNFFTGVKKSLSEAKEQNRQGIEGLEQMVNEYEAWVEQANNFRARYGLDSEESVRDASIRFVLGNNNIHTVCPTMNSFNDLETFVRLSGTRLKESEEEMLSEYSNSVGNYYCRHACGICEPSCPYGVPVNTIMRYNHYFEGQGREKYALSKYNKLLAKAGDYCSECAAHCEDNCPHNLPIKPLLLHADRNLTV